jgi:hypothetical protein
MSAASDSCLISNCCGVLTEVPVTCPAADYCCWCWLLLVLDAAGAHCYAIYHFSADSPEALLLHALQQTASCTPPSRAPTGSTPCC